VENCLARSEQFQELDRKLTKEANKLLEEVRAGHIGDGGNLEIQLI
jgi:hypothetical protein